MGNKQTSQKKKRQHNAKLKRKDFKFLVKHTNFTENEIKELFEIFMNNNPDGKLDKVQFVQLYSTLRPEGQNKLEHISQFVFNAFDQGLNQTPRIYTFFQSFELLFIF